jgi:DNA-binding phage protein
MPLTRSFRETVRARTRRDAKFPQALLVEAMQLLLDGHPDEGRSALRSCINASIGFEKLGATLGRSPKSLMRMFGPSGNPTGENLLAVISLLQAETRVSEASPLIGADGEVRELTKTDIARMRPARDVLPVELLAVLPKRRPGQRGSQKTPTKKQ